MCVQNYFFSLYKFLQILFWTFYHGIANLVDDSLMTSFSGWFLLLNSHILLGMECENILFFVAQLFLKWIAAFLVFHKSVESQDKMTWGAFFVGLSQIGEWSHTSSLQDNEKMSNTKQEYQQCFWQLSNFTDLTKRYSKEFLQGPKEKVKEQVYFAQEQYFRN